MDSILTTTMLLDRLRNPAEQLAWVEIDQRYRPILEGLARTLGLSGADAADVAQATLSELVRSIKNGTYDRTKGRLRSWIMGIARHKVAAERRAGARGGPARGDSALAGVPAERELDSIWELEQRQHVLRCALDRLRDSARVNPTTLRAFEMVALQGASSEDAARECGITVDAVYVAKSRLTRRLQELVGEITRAYSRDE
ncbi:MAG: sigma-70 family RNA polymerase sigma factor [Phycisphaerae bacterium]|nr:sigma-70 family RNA polymerase sigma factor [Phycisphaerae bacterium]